MIAVTTFAAEFPAFDKLPESAALPDVLMAADGTKIASREAWENKRATELRGQFQHYMYGAMPTARKVTARLLREDAEALGGTAVLREFEVDCGLANTVHLLVVTPKGAKAVPTFLGMNFRGNYQLLDDPKIALPKGWVRENFPGNPPNRAADAGRGLERETWPVAKIIARGYGFASFFSGDVVPDDAALAEKALAQFRAAGSERGAHDTAVIAAWAWGFSRMLDALATLPEVDAARVAAVGHSRNGKTALLAAAMDARFAMAIPSQAGSGGTGPSRVAPELAAPQANGRPKAETIAVINRSFPHWFSGSFKQFVERPGKLPFDQHCLIALCAPRPVMLSNAEDDVWANPAGQFELLCAAAPVYRLFGYEIAAPESRPALDAPLHERLGYFIRPGKHAMTTPDWLVWLDFADRWLKQ